MPTWQPASATQANPNQRLWDLIGQQSQGIGYNTSPQGVDAYNQLGGDVARIRAQVEWERRMEQQQQLANARQQQMQASDPSRLLELLNFGQPNSSGLLGEGGGNFTLAGGTVTPQTYNPTNPYEERLQQLLNDPDKVQQTAGYKFRVRQGQEALQRQMAARGMLGSGNRLMELLAYGQDMASQEYDKQLSRLGELTGQRNIYNLGRIGADNQLTLGREGHQVSREGQRIGALTNLYNTATQRQLSERELDIREQQIAAQAANSAASRTASIPQGSSGGSLYNYSMTPAQAQHLNDFWNPSPQPQRMSYQEWDAAGRPEVPYGIYG